MSKLNVSSSNSEAVANVTVNSAATRNVGGHAQEIHDSGVNANADTDNTPTVRDQK